MKFYGSLLALGLIGQTSAFVVQAPKVDGTALFSSYDYSTRTGYNPRVEEVRAQRGTSVTRRDERATYGGERYTNNRRFDNRPGTYDRNYDTGYRGELKLARNIWDRLTPTLVQGGSLRTWSITTPQVERVQVLLKTEGRPLNANVELWHGPDNTPQKMGVYVEDGNMRPFNCIVETPRGPNAVAIRNTGHMEFPMAACVEAETEDVNGVGNSGLKEAMENLHDIGERLTIQGGALRTYPFDPTVSSVQVFLKTDGRPLNARIELLQGPNNNKQVIEVYTEDGMERPLFLIIETPGVGNVVRIVNTATVEFPLTASVEPYLIEEFTGSNDDFFVLDDQW